MIQHRIKNRLLNIIMNWRLLEKNIKIIFLSQEETSLYRKLLISTLALKKLVTRSFRHTSDFGKIKSEKQRETVLMSFISHL
jgi:hypothetical protein